MSSKKRDKASKRDPNLVPINEAIVKKDKRPKNTAKKPVAAKADKKLSLLDAAAQVLKSSAEPMKCKGIIDVLFAKKLWHSDAPTPAATLASALLREITTKKSQSRFKKTGRGLFAHA